MLQERLTTVSKEQEEDGASVSKQHVTFYSFLLLLSFFSICTGSGRIKDGVCPVRLRCCVSGAAAAGCSSAAGEREDTAAGGLDAGETVTGERAQLLQGEGTNTPPSSFKPMRRSVDGRFIH